MIYAMHRLRVPSIIVIQLMMTYRYMNVLLNEAGVMYQAYTLRSGKERGIKMKDMGSFLGQLILRSMDRAERIYHGMKCRGFEGGILFAPKEQYGSKDIIILMVALSLFLLMRVINVSEILGEFLITSFR
jgi:cobalt/nickel transport system permease protein